MWKLSCQQPTSTERRRRKWPNRSCRSWQNPRSPSRPWRRWTPSSRRKLQSPRRMRSPGGPGGFWEFCQSFGASVDFETWYWSNLVNIQIFSVCCHMSRKNCFILGQEWGTCRTQCLQRLGAHHSASQRGNRTATTATAAGRGAGWVDWMDSADGCNCGARRAATGEHRAEPAELFDFTWLYPTLLFLQIYQSSNFKWFVILYMLEKFFHNQRDKEQEIDKAGSGHSITWENLANWTTLTQRAFWHLLSTKSKGIQHRAENPKSAIHVTRKWCPEAQFEHRGFWNFQNRVKSRESCNRTAFALRLGLAMRLLAIGTVDFG